MEQILYACLVLLPLGLSLRMSLRLLYGARGPQVGDPIYLVVNIGCWALTIIPLTVLIVVGANWLSGFLLMVAALSGLELILARRAMQRRSAWDLLTGTLGARQPAPAALRNHQGRFTGIVGRSFRELVQNLEQGADLRSAIGQHRSALPDEAQAYAAIDAIDNATHGEHDTPTAPRRNLLEDAMQNVAGQQLFQRFTYLFFVLLIMLGIVSFVMIKIVPSYQATFDDFGLDLPSVTVYLIATSELFSAGGVTAIVSLCFAGFFLAGLFAAVMYLCDVAVLRPIADRLLFSKHRALVLRLLAIAIERGQPLATATQQLAEGVQRYPSRFARQRLRLVHRAISAGRDWREAMRGASFIKATDLPILETAQQTGNLPWALRLLADQKIRMMIFRWSAFEQIAFPITILMVGLLVMWVCVALFLPLVDLIYGLV